MSFFRENGAIPVMDIALWRLLKPALTIHVLGIICDISVGSLPLHMVSK